MFDPLKETFIDPDIGKMLVLDPSLDYRLLCRGFQKSPDFHVERTPGRITWRVYSYKPKGVDEIELIDLDLLDVGQLSRARLPRVVRLVPGETLHVTYNLNWWYCGGGGSDLPSRGLIIRPKTLVPPLWRVPDLCFSLSC